MNDEVAMAPAETGEADDITPLKTVKRKKPAAGVKRWDLVKAVLSGFMNNIGMLLICVFYCMIGGIIFQKLEEPNEIDSCMVSRLSYLGNLNETVDTLWETASRMDLDESQQLDRFSEDLDKFRVAYSDTGWDGRDCETMTPKWKFWGAMVWCVTVVTTIGYGHIAPATKEGKLVFIFYSIVGIALMIMALTNIGAVLADIFKYTYGKVCCCGCCARPAKTLEHHELPPAVVWRTDGEGRPLAEGPTVLVEDSSEDESEIEDLGNVPLTVSILIIFSVLFLGAVMFNFSESAQEWDMLDSAYFSYVTLTTVGFGDMTPGTMNGDEPLDSTMAFLKLVMIGVYMVLGMATVSMCLQMMQDEVVSKMAWLSIRFGCDKKGNEGEPEQLELVIAEDIEEQLAADSDTDEPPTARQPPVRPATGTSPPPPYNDRPITGKSAIVGV